MTNGEFVDDKKIKDIMTYIKSMKHSEQIRMMFLFSLNGLRSINFAYLQVKDCYTDQLKPKDVINLDYDKNKGKHSCSYFLNTQMKKEFADYLKYLQNKWGENLNPETYLFTSQKLNKPYNRSFGCPYYGYAINKITLGNLIKLWNNGFVYKDFPLVHYRISHGDSSTHIAYIYRGKVFSHRFPYTDPNRYIPTEEVRKILKELRKIKN